MVDLRPPKFSLHLVRRNEVSSIRHQAFAIESLFKGYINGAVEFTPNAAQTPPNIPKFKLSDGKRTFSASDVSATLELNFGGSLPNGSTLTSVLGKPLALMKAIDDLYEPGGRAFRVLVLQVMRPYDGPSAELGQAMAETIGNPASLPKVSDMSCSYGAVTGGLASNLELSQYNFYEMHIQVAPGMSHVGFDPDFVKPTEQGVQVKIEVNSKPALVSGELLSWDDLMQGLNTISENALIEKVIGIRIPVR